MGSRSPHWMSLVERSFVGLVRLVMVLLGGGRDVLNVAPEFGSEACGRVVVGLVVELAIRVARQTRGLGHLVPDHCCLWVTVSFCECSNDRLLQICSSSSIA